MKILLTGASSFTGYWFAKHLDMAGHHVVAPLPRAYSSYEAGIRLHRVGMLEQCAEVLFECPFGSDKFLELAGQGPWDLLCHHAAVVRDYRSQSFDIVAAAAENTRSLSETLRRMSGLSGIVLTGSVFEEGEGIGSFPLRSFSPYGVSKSVTAQIFRYWAQQLGIPLGKFVVPNPFGPLEEPRFSSYLMGCLLNKSAVEVRTPDYVRDNIHVGLLASCYARFCQQIGQKGSGESVMRPSGYAESQGAFTLRYVREIGARLRVEIDVRLSKQEVFDEPTMRLNSDLATQIAPDWQEAEAWDELLASYLNQPSH